MKNVKLLAGLLSLLACLPLAATAQTVAATSNADLILGFRASGGTGATSNLEIDLGAITSYTTGANSVAGIHTIANLAGADLTATYGSSWATRSDLTWGIAGATGAANKTLYASFASTPGTQFAGSIDVQSQSLRNPAGNLIQGTIGALNGQSQTANSTFSAVLGTSDSSSWSTLAFADTGVAFGFFDTATFENNTHITGGSYVTSDLYRLTTAGAATYVGTFALNSSGTLFFSNTASSFANPVPEPSTYAAIAGVLALGAVVYRRQQKKAAV